MRNKLLPWLGCLAAAVSLASSSCTYDPYYSSAGGYYGDGYGYGGNSFSTSLFVSTGDPRWGYDPYTYCYYDYRSRRYYDPYLYGFYPVGYRPYAVYGVPHPHGWRPGHGHCPPPRTVRNITVVNYRDRETSYRNSDYSWARQVKSRPSDGSYRKPYLGSHSDGDRREDYRSDSRHRQNNDRDLDNSYNWAPRETSQPKNHKSNHQESRYRSSQEGFRQSGRSSYQHPVRMMDGSQGRQEIRPEPTRGQSMPRPQSMRQSESQKGNHNRSYDSPRRQDLSPSPSGKKDDSRNRKGIRGLGDA